MGMDLFEHNQTAYKSAVSMLETTGKAAIIHPTGTGKSFIALKLCEENPEKRVCWLSPSEYIFQIQIENWNNAVKKCSLKEKIKPEENNDFNLEKVDENIIQKKKPIRENKVLEKGHIKNFSNICFYTYAKLRMMEETSQTQIKPDYIILDEFHRCGATQWGGGVERLRAMYPNAKVLGLSATSIRYLDNQRDMAWELFDGNIASELTLGEAIARGILSAPKYILSIYSYQKELERYEERIKRTKNKAVRDTAKQQLEALRRALEQADGLDKVFEKHIAPKKEIQKPSELLKHKKKEKEKLQFRQTKDHEFDDTNFTNTVLNPIKDFPVSKQSYGKYLVFCASYDHLNEMKELAAEWFAGIDPEPHIYTAYSDDPKTAQEFEAFRNDKSHHLKLLYCIDMLNEGIHMDGIDGVILLRPTVSPTIYKQQIGRALASGRKTTPVIFDIVMNIENLYSIGAVEEELHEAVFSYRALGKEKELVHENFQIIDEVKNCRVLFARLNETLNASWEAMYAMASQYYREYGNLNVPKRYKTLDGYSLGMWIDTQRKVYAGKTVGTLSEIQIKKLSAIGMRWQGARELAWEKNYQKAKKYYEEYGNLFVGKEKEIFEQNKIQNNCEDHQNQHLDKEKYAALGRWLARLRLERKKIEHLKDPKENNAEKENNSGNSRSLLLTSERIAALDAIGMVWDVPDFIWEKNFTAAKKYYNKHGDLDVPLYYVDAEGIRLGRWIAEQRKHWNESKNQKTQTEESNAKDKKICAEEVKQNKSSKNRLTQEQADRLTAIGMNWDGKNYTTWEKSYTAASEYYKQYGNLDVPANYCSKDGYRLGRWIRRQREVYGETVKELYYRKNDFELSKENTPNQDSLEDKEQKQILPNQDSLKDKEQKQILPNQDSLEDNEQKQTTPNQDSLENKEQKQTTVKKNTGKEQQVEIEIHGSNVDFTRIQKLEQIGMIWDGNYSWEKKFQLAKQYWKEHGNLKMPSDYVVEGVWLDRWLREQKKRMQDSTEFEKEIQLQGESKKKTAKPLTEIQKIKLQSIGIQPGISQVELAWKQQYNEAKEFYNKYGNLSIPKRYVGTTGRNLGLWLQRQREGKRNGRLSSWQVSSLEGIGMIWESDLPWQTGFRHAKIYVQENGDLAVPNSYICEDGYRLGKWISNQRLAYHGGSSKPLDLEQIRQLEEIGMIWRAKPGRAKKKIQNGKGKF